MNTTTKLLLPACSILLPSLIGCVGTRDIRVTHYDLSLKIDPSQNHLTAEAEMRIVPLAGTFSPGGVHCVEFDLHRNLWVTDAVATGATVVDFEHEPWWRQPDGEEKGKPRIDRLYVKNIKDPKSFAVQLTFAGTLKQDIAAGEKSGQIHNFAVSSHISPEGTYLSPSAAWYPTPHWDMDDYDPAWMLAHWTVHVAPVDDYEFIATALRGEGDQYRWRSPHPMTGVMVTGGPHEVWSDQRGDVRINVHMQAPNDDNPRSDNEEIAQRYLDRAALYIERYEPLLGPFPYDQYTIIENFFSSGFAFPTLTLFGPMVMHMGENAFRHGYLDHELVHSWWGCAVDVDPRDGNWCESLTSYCTNHYGHILEGDDAGARKRRRDYSNFLSRLKPKQDKPLGTFGKPDGAGRGIAYSKGAAVFHMLARQIGQDAFWQACRSLTSDFTGRHANWTDLQNAFESASGQNLDVFFEQWVRNGGAPALRLTAAEYSNNNVRVELNQGDTAFDLLVPLRIHFADTHKDVDFHMTESTASFDVPVDTQPVAVELDPDYHVFRKLDASEIMPTSNTTKSGKRLTVIVPPGELFDAYQTAIDGFEAVVCKRKNAECRMLTADDDLQANDIGKGGVLIIGNAARHPVVQELLARSESPIRWQQGGFSIDGQVFDQPSQAVFATVHHPDSPADGITIYTGNSEASLANANLLSFYANSLLVFETEGRSEVVLRRDFESSQRIDMLQP